MTVAELIKALQTFKPEMEVVSGELCPLELVEALDRLIIREAKRAPARPAALEESLA